MLLLLRVNVPLPCSSRLPAVTPDAVGHGACRLQTTTAPVAVMLSLAPEPMVRPPVLVSVTLWPVLLMPAVPLTVPTVRLALPSLN